VAFTEVGLLVRAAAAGDEESWNALVAQYTGLVWSVARSFRLDDASAADVVQETWLRLATSLDRLRDPDRVGSWLVTTARHEALRVIRLLDRQAPTELDEERLVDFSPPLDHDLMRAEQHDELLDAFGAISARCQQLLRLLLAEPRIPYEEIAVMLDIPIGSIGPTRGRCLAALRDRLLGGRSER
jgi:RNA polymerase sigma factor (sigma-70 family)